MYRAAGDRTGQAAALNGVGWYYALLGNNQRALGYCHHGQAEAFYRQALGAYADLGDRPCRAHTLIHLAETHQATGNQAAARGVWRQALAILDELHHRDADAVRAKLQDA